MSNSLTVFDGLNLPAANIPKPAEEPGGYAQRIQLVSKGKLVDSGAVRPGHYAVVDGDTATDIGDNVDVIPLAVLDKALDCSGEEVKVVFGRDDADYKEIAERSLTPDSGCMYGPVFLVVERKSGRFFEVFFNNKSGRSEASKLYDYLPIGAAQAKAAKVDPRPPRAANLGQKYIKKPRYSWFAPVIKPSTETFDKLPTKEELVTQVTNFLKQAEKEEVQGGRDR